MASSHRRQVEALLAGARAEHAALLEQLSPALRASLPVDAAGLTQAIEFLSGLAGLTEDVRSEQARGHQANPAVLHGRVFGRAPLSPETVLAAFVDGARVRAEALQRLAEALGGAALAADVRTLLAQHPPPVDATDDAAGAALREAYAAQERAAVRIAGHVDDAGTR